MVACPVVGGPSSIEQKADNVMTETMRGDQALALGVRAAGVQVVTGYPGSPSTGVFDALLSATEPGQMSLEWAPNEKVAMEIAIGASLAGARSLVVLKSVGMNVGIDPLATFSLSGCHAGMVILLGDDPGAWGSQNEQDSRWLARTAEVPVIEPISVQQAAAVMSQAYAWSESVGTPVIVRITRALTLALDAVDEPWELPPPRLRFFRKRNRWIVLPALATKRHHSLHRRLRQMRMSLESSPYDVACGEGHIGVLAAGYTYAKLSQLLGEQPPFSVLGLSSVWPLPETSLIRWLRRLDQLLVLEEGGPFVEEQLRDLAQRAGLSLPILGRHTRAIPEEGELGPSEIAAALAALSPESATVPENGPRLAPGQMPSEKPLCDDCPYRPTFEALLQTMKAQGGRNRYIIVGETGCMVRANLHPLELFDVKYSLGSSLGLGLGLALSDPQHHVISILGDSSFFHSDVNALPYAVQKNPRLLMLLLDNGTTALTGGQAHVGSALDERGQPRQPVSMENVLRSYGIAPVICQANDPAALQAALADALASPALCAIIVQGPCPRYLSQ